MTLHPVKRLPLWPSHAERWINCSGQPRVALAAKTALGERQNSFAAEGTAAHAYLEARLKGKPLPRIVPVAHLEKEFDELNGELRQILIYADEDGALCEEDCKDRDELEAKRLFLQKRIDEANKSNAEQIAVVEEAAEQIEFLRDLGGFKMEVEVYLEYEIAHHVVNCKVDVLLHNATHVLVIDYKHGQGWKVACQGNPQMMLYGLAAYRRFPGRSISVAISQPRGVGDGYVEYEVPPEELSRWAETFETAARRAYANRAEYVIGPWCQGCPGMAGVCPAIMSETIDVIAEMPQPGADGPTTGTLPRPWWILDVAKPVREFVKAVEDDADRELWERRQVPGWELQESKGRRAWIDPDEVPHVLAEKLGGSPDDYCKTTKKPIGITEATKLAKGHLLNLDSMMHAEPVLKRVRSDGLGWFTDPDGTGFAFD